MASANGINNAFSRNKFFSAQEGKLNVLGLDNLGQPYTKLVPKGSGIVNVLEKMYWKNPGSNKEVPSVWVTERELLYGTWTTNLLQVWKQGQNLIGGGSVDSYLQLYSAEKTGFAYNLPYLKGTGDNLRSVQNQWVKASGVGDLLKSVAGTSGGLGDIGAAAAGAVVGAVSPGVGMEETKQFGNTTPFSLNVTFPLYNTISLESAFDHYCFVQLITFQNLKIRTSLLTFIPPKIYTVDTFSLGGVYMAAAYISDLKIDSIGTTRRMTDFSTFGPTEILIPEAYKISITFTDLVSPSANIFAGALGGSKIEVTNIDPTIQAQINQARDAARDTIEDFANDEET
jgi:hypothetical protein